MVSQDFVGESATDCIRAIVVLGRTSPSSSRSRVTRSPSLSPWISCSKHRWTKEIAGQVLREPGAEVSEVMVIPGVGPSPDTRNGALHSRGLARHRGSAR